MIETKETVKEVEENIDAVIIRVCKDIMEVDAYNVMALVALAQLVNARATMNAQMNCQKCSNADNILYELAEKLSNTTIHL